MQGERVKYVVYDCDNTMGIPGKDIDDGLTLLYLLGCPHVQLIGVTTAFGNASISAVHENTRRMFREIGIERIPLKKGAESVRKRRSEAAEYLARTVTESTVPVTVLATGACTNLYGASLIDREFFSSAEEIILMGGMTKPLLINGKKLDGLNFSADPEASYRVLSSDGRVTVITANLCTQAMLKEQKLKDIIRKNRLPVFKYMEKPALSWSRVFSNDFDTDGFYVWDIVAAVYISQPHLFHTQRRALVSDPKALSTGFLKTAPSQSAEKRLCHSSVNVPTGIRNIHLFWREIISAWKRVRFAAN
jgi:purine nucleosidase